MAFSHNIFENPFAKKAIDSKLSTRLMLFDTLTAHKPLRSQNATLEKGRGKHRKYLPYAFTEQGVAIFRGFTPPATKISSVS